MKKTMGFLLVSLCLLLCSCSGVSKEAKLYSAQMEAAITNGTAHEGNKLVSYFPQSKKIAYSVEYLPEALAAADPSEVGGIVTARGTDKTVSLTVADASDDSVCAKESFRKDQTDDIAQWITERWQEIRFSRDVKALVNGNGELSGSKLVSFRPVKPIPYSTEGLPDELAAAAIEDVGAVVTIRESDGKTALSLSDAPDGTPFDEASFAQTDSEKITAWMEETWEALRYHREIASEAEKEDAFRGTEGLLAKQILPDGSAHWVRTAVVPDSLTAASAAKAMGYVEMTPWAAIEIRKEQSGKIITETFPAMDISLYLGGELYAKHTFINDRKKPYTPEECDKMLSEWVRDTLSTQQSDAKLTAAFQNYTPSREPSRDPIRGVMGYDEDRRIYSLRMVQDDMQASGPEDTNYLLSYFMTRNKDDDEVLNYTLTNIRTNQILATGTKTAPGGYSEYNPETAETHRVFPPHGGWGKLFDGINFQQWQDIAIRSILGEKLEYHDATGEKLVAYQKQRDQYTNSYTFDGIKALTEEKFEPTEFFAETNLKDIGGYIIVESTYPQSTVKQYRGMDGSTVDITYEMESLTLTLIAAEDGHTIATTNFTVTSFTPVSTLRGYHANAKTLLAKAGDYFDVTGWIRTNWNNYIAAHR